MVFAWDGFWEATPSDQQLRLATYALRMLGSAAAAYAALPPAQVARCRRCASMSDVVSSVRAALRPPATPHWVKACLVAGAVQLAATRPQYLPAVEAFLSNSAGGACQDLHTALLNAIDALFSAAAAAGPFASLQPRPRAGLAIAGPGSGRRGAPQRGPSSLGSPADGSASPGGGSGGLSSVLRRMRTSLSARFSSSKGALESEHKPAALASRPRAP